MWIDTYDFENYSDDYVFCCDDEDLVFKRRVFLNFSQIAYIYSFNDDFLCIRVSYLTFYVKKRDFKKAKFFYNLFWGFFF